MPLHCIPINSQELVLPYAIHSLAKPAYKDTTLTVLRLDRAEHDTCCQVPRAHGQRPIPRT